MIMSPALRKFALVAHVVVSVGWVGAVVAYLALGIAAVTSRDAQTVRAAWIGMDLIGWLALVPLALAALVTGMVISLGTPWGLFRHYWVLISLALTAFATLILVLHMPSVRAIANMTRGANDTALGGHGGDLVHAGGGLLVLLVVTALNVYKPRGMTAYGWRKQREQRAVSQGKGESQ